MIAALENEHATGETMLKEVMAALAAAEGGGAPARRDLADAIAAYVRFQRRHMMREENELLPLAERALRDDDWRAVHRAFVSHADPLFGENLAAGFDALHRRIVERAAPVLTAATGPRTPARGGRCP